MTQFLEKLKLALQRSWKSLGNFHYEIHKVEEHSYEIIVYPALRELYGGSEDGSKVYPGFHFNVGKFIKLFNSKTIVSYDCMDEDTIQHLVIKGIVGKDNLKIAILSMPPAEAETTERVFIVGPKKGTLESKHGKEWKSQNLN